MFKLKNLDFATVILLIISAYILVSYLVISIWYLQNKSTPVNSQAGTINLYLNDSLYCQQDNDCMWQERCTNYCPKQINKYNHKKEIECEMEPFPSACPPYVTKCIDNQCSRTARRAWSIIDDPLKPFSTGYYSCEIPNSKDMVYRFSFCAEKTCWHSIYNIDMDILEYTGEIDIHLNVEEVMQNEMHTCQRIKTEQFEGLFPRIKITEPRITGMFPSSPPTTIVGKARGIFENTIIVKITSEDNNKIFWQDLTTATGPGEIWDYKDFSINVPNLADTTTDTVAIVHIFWESPKDGSPQDIETFIISL